MFCSADHDEAEFTGYFGKDMPWLAIPYDDPTREAIMGRFSVSGIPKLSVLAPSGRVIVDHAAGGGLSLATIDSWIESGSKM